MVDITTRDFAILISMSIAVVAMSQIFPAIGVAEAVQQEPPEFNVSADRWDFAGEFPDRPNALGQGQIRWLDSRGQNFDQHIIWLEDDKLQLFLDNSTDMEVSVSRLNGSAACPCTKTFSTADEGKHQFQFDEDGSVVWDILVDVNNVDKIDAANNRYNYTVDYNIQDRPDSDGGFISNVPLVGDVLGSGSSLSGMVGWIGATIWWTAAYIFEVGLNLLGILFDVIVFSTSFVVWLSQSYLGVVQGAGTWAGIVLSIPSLLIALELWKIGLAAIQVLPTT